MTRAIERLRRLTKTLGRGPFNEEFGGGSKDTHMMMMELPRTLDHLLHRMETRRLKSPASADADEGEKPDEDS